MLILLFIIAKNYLKKPTTDEWINKMQYVHTMEYYLAINKNYILTHATTWMDLEGIVLTERSKSQKPNTL